MLSVLGSTGSIGVQTLEVADNLNLQITALTAHKNIELLEAQARRHRPETVAVMDADAAWELHRRLSDTGITVLSGMDGVISAAVSKNADTVVNALVGNIGLRPTIAAISAGKKLALANKETLVTGGELITKILAEAKSMIYPIDSEHSAIFQCLQGNAANGIEKIYLTASGGPFRTKTREQLKHVTPADALKHPNWSMGAKITIDSATMMNKGLEVIEAKWLFGVPLERVCVLVHPQSIVHSMVEFRDGAVMAQMGEPDMRVPISYALTHPKRAENNFPRLDFLSKSTLTFEAPDFDRFPCLRLALEAAAIGGTMPAVMNAANEIAVELFLNEKIPFLKIPALIEKTMGAYTVQSASEENILAADEWSRAFAAENK